MEKHLLWCINNHLSSQLDEIQNEMVIERNMFFRRFVSIFKFPAIMSLVEPSRFLQSSANKRKPDTFNRIRTYQKKPKVKQLSIETKPNNTESFKTELAKESIEGKSGIQPQEGPIHNSYHSNQMTVSQAQFLPSEPSTSENSSFDEVRMKTDGKQGQKLCIADHLKRRINAVIQDLIKFPPSKTFFHESAEFVTPDSTPSKEPTKLGNSKSSKLVKKRSVPETKRKRETKRKVHGKARQKNVVRHSEQAELGTYVSKAKIVKTGATRNTEVQTETKTNSMINKNEKSCNSGIEISQSSFYFGKGELILENMSYNKAQANQELRDIELLDDILEKEKNTIDECFDF